MASLAPGICCESWKEGTRTGGQCGHRTGPMATGQLEPMGQLKVHLLCMLICNVTPIEK